MNSETRNCQNCKQDFIIEPDDFSFYEKIKVPPPTFCSTCRFERRLSFMNIYSLYKSVCDKCNSNIISMYHKDSGKKVFCPKCWWADDWDGTEYGVVYNPNRNFIEQYIEFKNNTPVMALDTLYSSLINTSYTNYSSHLKNCYGLFFADYAENSFYCDFLNTLKDSSDCFRIRDSEKCHDCVGVYKCFGCVSCDECDNSINLIFSKNCSGCSDCFGCINLRKKSYCIYNEQYTKEEYFEFIEKVDLSSYSNFEHYKKESREFWLKNPVKSMYGNSLNVNVSGEYIFESKNTKDSYMVTSAEDSRFIQLISVEKTKDSYDYTCWGGGAELIYEALIAGHGASNIKFSIGSYPDCLNNEYCYYASSCKNVFGCANLKRKSYCILNREYSKEEYEALKNKIIEDMKINPFVDSKGRIYKYGEFFPFEFSAFGYNETFANVYFPKTKEQTIHSGYRLAEVPSNEYVHNIESKNLPDKISNRSTVLDYVIKCDCGRCFKIVDGEIDILDKLNLSIPRKCSECRRWERFSRSLSPIFYNRTCNKCGTEIKTSYAPDRSEIVYCEKCYQQEVM